jgi:hypothetical protein
VQGSPPEPLARARDAGLERLKRTTRVTVVGATALAGGVAALAAHSFPGHKANAATAVSTNRTVRSSKPRQSVQPTAPSDEQAPAPAQTPPAAPVPAPTTSPPVATSGTS